MLYRIRVEVFQEKDPNGRGYDVYETIYEQKIEDVNIAKLVTMLNEGSK